MLTPSACPRERRLKDPLAQVAGEEQVVLPLTRHRPRKSQLHRSDVLSLINHDVVIGTANTLCVRCAQGVQETGKRLHTRRAANRSANLLKNSPQIARAWALARRVLRPSRLKLR